MSAADVFLSSPAGPARFNPYTMSSSPNLPSLNEIFKNDPDNQPLPTGSHTASISDNGRTTFASAATLLRDAPEIDIETEQLTKSPRSSNLSKSRKGKIQVPEPTNIPMETPILIESSPGEKSWQKFKSKKSASQGEQPPIPKARATKANNKGKCKEKTETVSEHFAAKESATKRVERISDNEVTGGRLNKQATDGPSCSEPALRRRDHWTPPPSNSPFPGSQSDNRELPSPIDGGTKSQNVFHTLQGQYGYKDTSSCSALEPPQQLGVLKKQKLIELVSTSKDANHRSRETSPPKVVNTKKKTRTITELATAPYMPLIEPSLDLTGPATKDSLLSYFDSDGAVKALVEHQTAVMTQKKEKAGESKAPKKPRRKKKSGTADNPILLSPNSALKQSSNQDFVFGTSSQLVREESPTTLRDLQLAIQASNQVNSDPFAEPDSQGLWHAGARDTDGELMKMDDVEIIDLPSSPRQNEQRRDSRNEFVDINDILKSSEIDESSSKDPQQNSHFFQSQAIPSAQPSETNGQELKESHHPTEKEGNLRPDFELLNDSQLATRIASYGFKPVKKRQTMIALLDQCWTSQNSGVPMTQSRSISTSSNMNAPKRKQATPAAIEPANPPKRRGRPKKDSAPITRKASAPKEASPKRPRSRQKKETPKPVEIADSDLDEAMSSSSKASSPDRDRVFSSPPPVDLSISDDADMSLTMQSPTDQQADLFRHITRAVKEAPRSRDPANPSWYEKMLLYDPVILEDLAAWLNAGALGGVGYDGEVSPFDVKKWCESKSVICLWRQNMNGKSRKRY